MMRMLQLADTADRVAQSPGEDDGIDPAERRLARLMNMRMV